MSKSNQGTVKGRLFKRLNMSKQTSLTSFYKSALPSQSADDSKKKDSNIVSHTEPCKPGCVIKADNVASGSQSKTETEKVKNPLKKEEFIFFYGPSAVFSQFHKVDFVVDGEEYCCMEQYMHHQKAVLFKDFKTAKSIMETTDPKTHKKLGRKVTPFNPKTWGQKSVEVVRKGNIEKFSQNKKHLEIMFSTYPKTLVEASPRDRLWGIGMGKNNENARDRSKWRGKNLLGETLTDVRRILMKRFNVDPHTAAEMVEMDITIAATKPSPKRKQTNKEKPSPIKSTPYKDKSIVNKDKLTPNKDMSTTKKEIVASSLDTSSPNKDKTTPKKDRTTPMKDKTTPKKDKTTPKKDKTTPKKDKTTPKKDKTTPKKDKTTPKKDKTTPKKDKTTPKKDKTTPNKNKTTPKKDKTTPEKDKTTPEKDTFVSNKDSLTPRKYNQDKTILKNDAPTTKNDSLTLNNDKFIPCQYNSNSNQQNTPDKGETTKKNGSSSKKRKQNPGDSHTSVPKKQKLEFDNDINTSLSNLVEETDCSNGSSSNKKNKKELEDGHKLPPKKPKLNLHK